MKSKCRLTTVMVILFSMWSVGNALAEEKTKEYHESWPASGVQTLQVNNKFGEIKINNSNGGQVTIDVLVTVEASNEAKAEELLEKINVRFDKSGNTVMAETMIAEDFKSRQQFSIDYQVNIPSDKNLDITNKYGNTIVGTLNANGNFDVKYGNLTASQLNAPENGNMDINLEYGKADISSADDIQMMVKYSTVNFGDLDDLTLDSKYTVLSIDKVGGISIDSKYDTFDFEAVESLTAETKYSHFKIGTLANSMRIDAGYGGIRVDNVGSGFDFIDITNSYGQVALGLEEADYMLDASCDYCGISYPESRFQGDKVSENHTRKINGKVGSGVGGKVNVTSRYGEIKLAR